MKYLVISFLMMFGCNNSKMVQNDGMFEVISATSKKSIPGVAGANITTKYVVTVSTLKHTTLELKQLWLKDKGALDFEPIRNQIANIKHKKGTQLKYVAKFVKVGSAVYEAMKKAGELPKEGVAAPKEFAGEALVSYEIDGEIYYLELEKIEKLETVRMP